MGKLIKIKMTNEENHLENKVADQASVVMQSVEINDPPKKEEQVDERKYNTLRMANSGTFIFAMIFNATAQKLAPVSLREITDQWNLPISPANWAFAIWSVIYLLLAIFTVY